MKSKLVLGLSLAVAGASLPAQAKMHDRSPSINSGFYVGALLGYNSTKYDSSENFFFANPANVPAGIANTFGTGNTGSNPLNSNSSSGSFTFAGLFGYRHVFENNFIVGVEVEAGKNTGSRSFVTNTPFTVASNLTGRSSTTISNKFFVKPVAVIGYKVNDRFALFGKIGANIAKFNYDNTYVLSNGGAAINTNRDSRTFTRTGLVVGAAAEYALSHNVSLVADASYTHFGSSSVTLSNPSNIANVPALAGATHTATVKPRFITARIGAIYRF